MEYYEGCYKICRVCNSNCSEYSELTYNCAENFAYKLTAVVPEVDLSLSFNPIICKECARILDEAYLLRLRCLETQTYLYNTFQNSAFKPGAEQNIPELPVQNGTNGTVFNNCCKLEISDIQISTPNSQITTSPQKQLKLEELRSNTICNKCTTEFQSIVELEIHKCINFKEETVDCPICNKVCRSKRQLKSHSRVHEDLKPFCCEKCAKCFKTRQQLTTHMNIHEDRKLFLCNECGKGFSAKGNLIVHVRRHTGERPYTCPVCDKKFTVKCNMQYHLRHTHGM